MREDACRCPLFSCVENGFPLFRKLNQKRACAIVPLFSRRQLHKKDDLCNCWPFFEQTIAQRVQRAMLFRMFRMWLRKQSMRAFSKNGMYIFPCFFSKNCTKRPIYAIFRPFLRKIVQRPQMVALIAQRVQRAMLFRGSKGMNNCTAATLKA